MNEQTLKPCPLCSTAEKVVMPQTFVSHGELLTQPDLFSHYCATCNLSTDFMSGMESRAAAYWNALCDRITAKISAAYERGKRDGVKEFVEAQELAAKRGAEV